jgi:hypothetical protein
LSSPSLTSDNVLVLYPISKIQLYYLHHFYEIAEPTHILALKCIAMIVNGWMKNCKQGTCCRKTLFHAQQFFNFLCQKDILEVFDTCTPMNGEDKNSSNETNNNNKTLMNCDGTGNKHISVEMSYTDKVLNRKLLVELNDCLCFIFGVGDSPTEYYGSKNGCYGEGINTNNISNIDIVNFNDNIEIFDMNGSEEKRKQKHVGLQKIKYDNKNADDNISKETNTEIKKKTKDKKKNYSITLNRVSDEVKNIKEKKSEEKIEGVIKDKENIKVLESPKMFKNNKIDDNIDYNSDYIHAPPCLFYNPFSDLMYETSTSSSSSLINNLTSPLQNTSSSSSCSSVSFSSNSSSSTSYSSTCLPTFLSSSHSSSSSSSSSSLPSPSQFINIPPLSFVNSPSLKFSSSPNYHNISSSFFILPSPYTLLHHQPNETLPLSSSPLSSESTSVIPNFNSNGNTLSLSVPLLRSSSRELFLNSVRTPSPSSSPSNIPNVNQTSITTPTSSFLNVDLSSSISSSTINTSSAVIVITPNTGVSNNSQPSSLKIGTPPSKPIQSSSLVPDVKPRLQHMGFSPQHPCALSFIQIVYSLTINISCVGVWAPLERYCQVLGVNMCMCYLTRFI